MAEKTVKAKDLREQSADDLLYRLGEIKKDLFEMRVKCTTKELTDTARIRARRREVAKILTILGEKKRASAAGAK